MGAVTPDRTEDTEAERLDADAQSLSGQLIGGRFRLGRLLGRGGMGEVREAEHVELGRRVAVKLMHGRVAGNRTSVTRLKREARSMAAISHPHIVQVLDAGEHGGAPFLVMELLEGEDLRTRLDRHGPLSLGEAIVIATQILAGLDAVHAAGIVHRDVKPENVFLTAQPDGTPFVKLLDFGVSKLMEIDSSAGNLTESGTIVGSPAFMAPEQAIGSSGIDARTDLYSVGAVLYTMLAGRSPFHAPNIPAVLLAIVEGRAEPLKNLRPALPAGLLEVVERAMDKERGKRFRSASEFAAALQPFVPTGVQVAAVPNRALRRWLPHVFVATTVAVLAVFALGGRETPPARARSASPAPPARPTRVDRPAPAVERPPAPAPAKAAARLEIEVRPPRAAGAAQITFDGQAVQGGAIRVDPSPRPRVLSVRAPGYGAREVTIVVDRDSHQTITLEPEGARPRGDHEIYRGPIKLQKERPF